MADLEAEPITKLPGEIEENEDSPKKRNTATDVLTSVKGATDVVTKKASFLTDGALGVMGRGFNALDEKVPEERTCCKRCLKRCRGVEDPVQGGRCSAGRLGFSFLALVALVFVIWELVQGLGSSAASATFSLGSNSTESGGGPNLVELGSNLHVFLLALFCATVLGGDIFMFEQFVSIVNKMQTQVTQFSKHNDALEEKLDALGHVEQGLEQVYRQMNGDIQATTNLLVELDRFGKLQTVGAVVNQYFAADLTGTGYISGPEAQFLAPQLILLWDLVPGFDQKRFVDYVQEHGLRLPELATILDHMVANDGKACLDALESLCGEERDVEGNVAADKIILSETEHQAAVVDAWLSPVVLDVHRDVDVEANRRPGVVKAESAVVAMAPPSVREVQKKDEGPVLLKPLFSVPIPSCMKHVGRGAFTLGERCSIWGWWHAIALFNIPVSIFFFIGCILGMEVPNIILATVGLCLTLGLTGTGKMIEVLRALRKLHKQLKTEVLRLEASVADLGDKVGKLSKLQHGFERLQKHCAGNVTKARELIEKSNTKVKMEAMATVTHLFKHAGLNVEFKLEGQSAVEFLESLELIFGNVPGFDISAIREKIGSDQIDLKQVNAIVDIIATFGGIEEEASPGSE